MRRSLAVASVAAVLTIALPALPCSIVMPSEHTIDTTSSDRVPPTIARAETISVARGQGPRDQGCGSSSSSCDDIGWFRLGLQGADDVTAPNDIGWSIELESGTLPGGMTLPTTPVRTTNLEIQLSFLDGAKDEQEEIDCVLRVFAVDRAGNKSAPARVTVSHPGREDGSCGFGMRGVRWGWAMLGAAIVLVWRRRAKPSPVRHPAARGL